MTQSSKKLIGRRFEINNLSTLMKMLAIGSSKYRASARRQDTLMLKGQVVEHLLLNISEPVLPFALKILANGTTQATLDRMVRVDKGKIQAPGQLAPDRGLA